ncbi:MAG: DUF881 domain-containing protein [Armatimonadetes bacterium]|nr:DUF881 domain-containing protein [Armatimonadota bacterium]
MNASSPLSTSSPASTARGETKTARVGRSWIFSLTGVCFVFGGLLAMQMRATQQVQANRARETAGIAEANQMAAKMKAQADQAAAERVKTNEEMKKLRDTLASRGSLSASQVAALNSQIKDLQMAAGLTPVSGPGIRITLSDNPNAAKVTSTMPVVSEGWGLVHDYDLLQVVNELRSAKADAIAVRGPGGQTFRLTSYTPIRCVGPVVYVNWEPVAAPFTIEAVGDPATLKSVLNMPNGIVDNLRNNGAVGVKVEAVNDLKLPAATGGAPKLRVANGAA